AADYTVWRDSFGRTGAGLSADADGSNTVDMADYNLWKANFGRTSGSGAGAAAAVPEPPTWLLLLAAALAACGAKLARFSLRRAASRAIVRPAAVSSLRRLFQGIAFHRAQQERLFVAFSRFVGAAEVI